MLCIYSADCTDFSGNGLGVVQPQSCTVTETLNGEWELTLEHPIDEYGKWTRLAEGNILRAPVPAAMTPQVNLVIQQHQTTTHEMLIYKVSTSRDPLRLRSGTGTNYKILSKYKKGTEVIVLNKTTSSWYEVTCPDGKHGYKIGKRTYVTPKISDIIVGGAEDIHLFDTPLYLIRARGLNFEERFFKRTMDIVCCLLALAVSWPFMIAIAVAIKAEDGGPVFYKQRRCTRDNREFNILKFRSMIVNAEKDGRSIPAVDHDPRITKVGRVIRALRVDELPQIFNILSGKMSIVGPRPERIEHVQKYTQEIPEFAFRAKVKGGLTGYAQVYGKYNTTAYDKLKLDLMYIEHYSFMLDCKLILMTVATMFKKESTEGFDKQIEVAEKAAESTEAKQIAS